MEQILQFLKRKNQIKIWSNIYHNIELKAKPQDLIKQLNQQPNTFKNLTSIKEEESSEIKMRKMTLLHFLIFHSNQFRIQLERTEIKMSCSNQWLKKNFQEPYMLYLQKISHSQQLYSKIKIITRGFSEKQESASRDEVFTNKEKYINFQVLFYCINLLKQNIKITKNVETYGRYFKDKYFEVSNCNEMMCLEMSHLYLAFTFIITMMIKQMHNILKKEEDKKIFQCILNDEIKEINYLVFGSLLNKLSNVRQKGIFVSILLIEQVDQNIKQNIDNIMGISEEATLKQNKKKIWKSFFQ